MTNEQRYREALEAITRLNGHSTLKAANEIAAVALSPPDEWEEVEVNDDVFMVVCINPNAVSPNFKGIFYDKSRAETIINSASNPDDFLLVNTKLTGTYKCRKPKKVLRREEIIVRCGDYQLPTSREYRSFTGLEKIYREWYEETE